MIISINLYWGLQANHLPSIERFWSVQAIMESVNILQNIPDLFAKYSRASVT